MEPEGPPAPSSAGRRAAAVIGLVLAVMLVGWLVRPPVEDHGGQVVEERPTPTPMPDLPSARPAAPADPVLLGLGEVMPVVDGTWEEVVPPGGRVGATPRAGPPVFIWDGGEVVVVDGRKAQAWDPVADIWRDLPDLPLGEGADVALSGVAVEGRAIVTDAMGVAPVPAVPAPARSWVLTAGTWQPVASIPGDGQVIGAAGGRALVARTAATYPEGVEVWAADVRAAEPERLPDLPVALVGPRVVALPDGFVLLGTTVIGGNGSEEDPFQHQHAALRWRDDGWTIMDLPALRPFATAGTEVARPTALLHRPADDAPGLQLIGLAPDRPLLRLIGIDGADALSTIDVPIPEAVAEVLEDATTSLAWNTADRVWLYGGYGSAVHLGITLSTGAVSAAVPTDGRVHAQAVWVDDAMLLLGGFGPRGPVGTIHRWTPADG